MSASALCCVLFLLVIRGHTQHDCPPGTYMDKVTGNCDQCGDLCDEAVVQGTVDECKTRCPDYAKSDRQCPVGQYYDPVLSHCDLCSSICTDHKQQGTTETCRQKCPQEYKENTLQESVVPEKHTDHLNFGGNVAIPVVISIVALSCACISIIVLRHQLRQRLTCFLKRPEQCSENLLSTSSSGGDVRLSIEETGKQEIEGFAEVGSERLSSTVDDT